MYNVGQVIFEQIKNRKIIFRLAKYEEKATYQNHYLGLIWQFLNPLIQIGIYYLVFGIGVNGGRQVSGVPFICWMLIGITAWFYIYNSLLGTSNSIYKQIGMVSKMKFPTSILPMNNMVSNLYSYFPMLFFTIVILFYNNIYPTIYWLQYIYYFLSMFIFLFAFGILNATLTAIVRDFHITLQSILRLLFYFSGSIWDIDNRNLPVWLVKILKINPIYYLLNGFRDSFLSRAWFWDKMEYTIFFWSFTLIVMIVACNLHMKFRAKFMELV